MLKKCLAFGDLFLIKENKVAYNEGEGRERRVTAEVRRRKGSLNS